MKIKTVLMCPSLLPDRRHDILAFLCIVLELMSLVRHDVAARLLNGHSFDGDDDDATRERWWRLGFGAHGACGLVCSWPPSPNQYRGIWSLLGTPPCPNRPKGESPKWTPPLSKPTWGSPCSP